MRPHDDDSVDLLRDDAAPVDATTLSFELIVGQDAHDWRIRSENRAAWRRLYDACSWSTVFQSPDFFDVWFRHYGATWSPLLVIARRGGAELAGLMPLASRGCMITGVGAHQAEYQGWISHDTDAEAFADGALNRIAEALPRRSVLLRYLPHGLPSAMLARLDERNARVTVQSYISNEFAIDERAIARSLNKKGNKSKLRRLKRIGHLSLRTLDASAFAEALNEIAAMYDFRRGAINGVCPFLDDPHKGPFHVDWFMSEPHQLHATGLYLDDHIISALVFAVSKSDVHFAISAHAPAYAACSPNKFHIYETALALACAGRRTIDLTPGGDAWKERFSTGRREAWELKLHRSVGRAVLTRTRRRARALANMMLESFGQGFNDARRIRRAAQRAMRAISSVADRTVLFTVDLAELQIEAPRVDVSVDALDLLMRWAPALTGRGRQPFLSEALSRIEGGERCYTVSGSNGLLCLGWMSKQEGAFLLHDFSVAADADSDSLRALICRMVSDLKTMSDQNSAQISISVRQSTLIDVAGKTGFARLGADLRSDRSHPKQRRVA